MTTIETQLPTRLIKAQRPLHLRARALTALKNVETALIAFLDWQDRARQRRQLLSLSDAALKDFGANRATAAAEGDKPFWQA